MQPAQVDIKFEPDNVHARVEPGTTVLRAAQIAGVPIAAACGGRGRCGKCRCRVVAGQVARISTPDDGAAGDLSPGVLLACRTEALSDLTVHVVPEARAGSDAILEAAEVSGETKLSPEIRKVPLTLPSPSLSDQRADLERLWDSLSDLGVEPSSLDASVVLPTLAAVLREQDFVVTAVLDDGRLIAVEPGDTTGSCYGVAVDVGTTTVVAYLVDLNTGERVAVASDINPQVNYGDDVVSRISFITRESDGLGELGRAIRGKLCDLIAEACALAGVLPVRVYRLSVVGNAAMTHVLLGADPRNIPMAPYTPSVHRAVEVPARELSVSLVAAGARLATLPNIAGWVGADTVGVILSTRMHELPGIRIAIDIGTNGEVIVGGRDGLVACSTAAGPAFEGAQIRHGMRGATGAVDHAYYEDGDLRITTIGGAAPRGICGTGLIDLVAQLLRAGVLDETGRMIRPDTPEALGLPAALRDRVVTLEGAPAFVVASDEESATEGPIVLTQRDVRQLQLAKGAIAAGIRVALRHLRKSPGDISEVLLAGAFGTYADPANAAAIGLFPKELGPRARSVGNAAGAGAVLALLSADMRREADEIGRSVSYLELASSPEFDEAFAEEMLFPHG